MTLFWATIEDGGDRTYRQLVTEVNDRTVLPSVVYSDDPWDVFTALVKSIVVDRSVTVLDPALSAQTIEELGFEDELTEQESVEETDFDSPAALIDTVFERQSWEVTLYTSGTTGTPKPVTQSLGDLTRNVRREPRTRDATWAFAYNPTHIAGLQVFFQAFGNLNPMVYIFESSPIAIADALSEYGVTHLSATPTFYRLKVLQSDSTFPAVERITTGGEKFQSDLVAKIERQFPNAELRNIYALTEAGTILESDGATFEIGDDDRVDVSDDGELLIHESLIGRTPEVTDDEWYQTGDLVETVEPGRIEFVGRDDDLVNIGGYEVNTATVEAAIRGLDEVVDVVVSTRSNSVTGTMLVADVELTSKVDASERSAEIKSTLQERLPSHEVPRLISVVENIDTSRTGKKQRE
ncbi:AMP-binding protein [Haloarcula sp. CGMCC 1.2071]|uniref:AMP-binding protein n=1 Tax=Haloarcula sp. CGMCC 1.2071 TaxID=3111454 RepID=UPI00300F6F33